jgi:hypothetical protein
MHMGNTWGVAAAAPRQGCLLAVTAWCKDLLLLSGLTWVITVPMCRHMLQQLLVSETFARVAAASGSATAVCGSLLLHTWSMMAGAC